MVILKTFTLILQIHHPDRVPLTQYIPVTYFIIRQHGHLTDSYCEGVEPADNSVADNYLRDRPSVNLTKSRTSPKTPTPEDVPNLQVRFRQEPETVGPSSILVRGSPITITKPVGYAGETACGSRATVRISGKSMRVKNSCEE